MEMMRKLLFLSILLITLFCASYAQDATYMVQVQYSDGVTTTQGLPAGVTPSDISWTFELHRGGATCSKSETDQLPVWPPVSGTDPTIMGFQLNLSIFTTCNVGTPTGWVPGDQVVLKMTINKSGNAYDGATASSTLVAVAGITSGIGAQGIIFEKPILVPTISVSNLTLCAGTTGAVAATVANAPTGYTINWGDANITTGSADTVGNVGAGLTVGTHNLTAELRDAGGTKVADANYTVTVKANPAIALNKTEVCKGEKVKFSVTGGQAAYTWSGGSVSGSGTSKELTCSTTPQQAYSVIVTDANGCRDSVGGNVTVNDLPTVTNLAAVPIDGCVGESLTLTATATGGSGTYTSYTWTGPGTSGTTATSPGKITAAGTDANTFTVKVTDDKGCKSTAAATRKVTGYQVHAGLSANPASVPNGGSSHLTATPAGAANYTWYGDPVNALNDTARTQALTSTGHYNVIVEDAHGCKDTASTTVTVTGGALDIAPVNQNLCTASLPTTLDAGESGGSGTYTYQWTTVPGITLSSTTAQHPQVTNIPAEGTYTINVEVKDAVTGGTKNGSVTLTITETPVLSALTATPSTVTPGNSSVLSVTVTPSTSDLRWTGGTVTPATGTPVTTDPLTAATTYTVEAKNGTCTAQDQITVNVAGAALVVTPPAITPSGPSGTPINACVTVTGGDCGGNYTYAWNATDAGVTVTPGAGACASVTATTIGRKEVCVTVTCGIETENVCFDVDVTGGPTTPPVLTWDVTPKVCANSNDKMTITMRASGGGNGAKYSFVLYDKQTNAVKTVVEDAGPTWTHVVSASDEGTYTLSGFSAKAADGTVTTGSITPGIYIDANFNPVPIVNITGVTAGTSVINNCAGDQLILEGTGTATKYVWDDGTQIQNGQPFIPTGSGQHILYSENEFHCSRLDTVNVVVNPKPQLQLTVQGTDICPGESVVLNATADLGATVSWNNGVQNGVPFQPALTGVYTATATAPGTGCTISKDTTVVVKEKPVIVRHSKNPRNIAIGKDVYFAVTAAGSAPLTYQWYRKVNNVWSQLSDNSISLPTVSGTRTDSLVLKSVPESWDGSELKIVVTNDCDTTSMVFQLGVKECFDIEITLLMQDGIIPDTDPTNKIDGWYCRGQQIALRAVLTSLEGYDIENAHYKWTIDGLELPEEHYEMETDTCVLTWVPEFQEDDIVVKVCGYSDGACEEVCARYLRLKAREFEKVSLDLLTSVDPEHRFCPGDTVDFWVATRNVGDSARFDWYNDIFHLPTETSPRNELLSYSDTKVKMVMGQEDTWMKVFVTPSKEVCTDQPVYVDTVFLRKKEWVTPSLKIINNIDDTLACRGDRILFTAVYENAGTNPTFTWRKDVWDWGHSQFTEATLDDKDMWLKCWLIPGNDVCYSGEELVDSMVIRVLENPTVTISADMTNKAPGDEIIVESEVVNMPTNTHYTWYLNHDYTLNNSDYPEYISDKFAQGDVIQCGVKGERICTMEVLSNELVIYYGGQSRDTMITIYQGEKIHNLNMRRKGDTGNSIFRITADGYPRWGVGSMKFNGHFDYTPNTGFVGSDVVKYEVVDKFDQSKVETGYIYISILDRQRFFIPNIITPNGDGFNDTWQLDFLAEYPDHHITIYNREGVVVFEATNYQNDWDGTGTNSSGYISHFNLANGVYTYVIDLGNKEILKNWIEIRRDMNRGKYKY